MPNQKSSERGTEATKRVRGLKREVFDANDGLLPPIVKIIDIKKSEGFYNSPKSAVYDLETQISEKELGRTVKGWKSRIVELKGHKAVIEYIKESKEGYWEKITVVYLGGFRFLEAKFLRYTSKTEEEFEDIEEADIKKILRKYKLKWYGMTFFEDEGILHDEYADEGVSAELDVAFENPRYAQGGEIKDDLTSLENYR